MKIIGSQRGFLTEQTFREAVGKAGASMSGLSVENGWDGQATAGLTIT